MIEYLGEGKIRFRFRCVADGRVQLVGDFNEWDESRHAMERQTDGSHELVLALPPGEYEFKYLSGQAWFNDERADKYVRNCWGSENSVVIVPAETSDRARNAAPAASAAPSH